jgi:hypothetical protein
VLSRDSSRIAGISICLGKTPPMMSVGICARGSWSGNSSGCHGTGVGSAETGPKVSWASRTICLVVSLEGSIRFLW